MRLRVSGVYLIRNTVTGDCYVGSSTSIADRLARHIRDLRKGCHYNHHLQSAFNKYGEDNFTREILEEVVTQGILIEREQHWIDTLKPCYNKRLIAESNAGLKRSAESIERQKGRPVSAKALQTLEQGRLKRLQSDDPKLRQPRLGMKNSEVTRRKQSEAAKQRGISEETRAKMVAGKQGKGASEAMIAANRKIAEARRGHAVSEETRQTIAETNRATWAKKTAEEKHSYTQKRPPVSQVTRQRQSEAAKRRRNKSV